MNALEQKNVLVLGLGASGLAQARWCARWGARVSVADTRAAPPQLATLQAQLPGVRFVSGPFSAQLLQGQAFDLVLKSPGLSPADIAPVIDAAKAAGIPCGNELTLFAQALRELGTSQVDQSQQVGGEVPLQPVSPHAAPRADLGPAPSTHQEEASLATVAGTGLPADAPADAQPEVLAESLAESLVEVPADAASQAPAGPTPLDTDEGSDAADEKSAMPIIAPPPPDPGYHPKVIAITGTNGKTTVTSLTGQLVKRAGKTVAVAGNIGPTLLDTLSDCLDAQSLPEVWVLELSSFQLDQVNSFEPTVATILNISQDHLDWHGSMQAYAAAKAGIYGQRGIMLLNRADAQVMKALPPLLKGKPVRPYLTFDADEPQRPGDYGIETVNGMSWLVRASEADETIKRRKHEEIPLYVQRLMPVDALRIRGLHNATNALAALGLAAAAGCSMASLLHGLREYRGEPHRLESVAVVNDVEYFDDSKGTNVGATVAALNGLGPERKLVVILGGEGKGQDFAPLAEPVARHVRAAVLLGRDAPLIRLALAATGVPLLDAGSMQQAVQMASGQARRGDAVVMSPACASFDMFDNYEHRAHVFCDAVSALAQDAGLVC
jgi:UDP-N-acetylmuramoylalanine--D-glutamate ligase